MIFQQRHAAHCVVKMCKLVLQVEKEKKEEQELGLGTQLLTPSDFCNSGSPLLEYSEIK